MSMIDISKKLSNDKPVIKIAEGKEYKINNSKNTMLLINQEMQNNKNELAAMDKVVKLALGQNAFQEIESMELSFADYKVLFIGIMAGVSDQSYEEVEKNFNPAKDKQESWYDLLEDYDLIEASFAKQYGIRLRNEQDMTWSEFATLLSGLMPDTPLGQIISIRAEKDKEVIKRFTKDQKRIQSDWKRRQSKNVDKESYEDAMNAFKNMFISMANSK